MDAFRKLEFVKFFIKEEIKRLESLLSSVESFLFELQDSKCEYVGLSAAVDVLASSCQSVEDANKSFLRDFNYVSSIIKPVVQWHSNKKEMLEMFYLDGNSPWSIWLTYNPSTEIDGLYKILEQRHAKGFLKKLKNPKVGDFICCYDKKILFRAVIIDVSNTRIKVINVDRYNVKIIKLDSCYEITKDLCDIHAYSIQCCLMKEKRFEKKWNEDLGRLFQNTLRECRLTVRIVEEIQSFPPLFVVEMYAFNEALEVETNISEWIISRLLPELNNLSDNNDHVLDHFSDEALDPFLVFSTLLRSTSETSSSENNNELPSSPNGLVEYVSGAMPNISLEENCMKEKPRNRLAHLISPNTVVTVNPNSTVSLKNEGCMKTNSCVYNADDATNSLSFSDIYASNGVAHYRTENNGIPSTGLSNGNQTNDIYNGNMVNGFYDQILYEDSIIPSNYIPTDDGKICSFYAKKGYCWKPGCKKQHTKVEEGRWTEDSTELFKDAINTLNLPGIGSMVTLKVTYVVFCNMFYALLPDSFSDTGDVSETGASLNKSLNNAETKREFKLLLTPPCLGQLLVAYSSEKSLWLRAVVRDIHDHDILQVFFVDFGMTEELSLDKCREIEPQFVHLPCQAVYCTLANVFVDNLNDEEGKKFLESLLLDKEIEVEIIDRDIVSNRLEIVVFHNGVNINQLLIDHGYCLPFKR